MENKKKIPLPLLVLIVSFALGIVFAGIGLIKQGMAKKTNEERAEIALKQSEAAVDAANKRLDEIVKEYDSLKKQYDDKVNECDSIAFGSDGWFEKSEKCSDEEMKLQTKLWELEMEDTAIKNKDYTVYYDLVKPMSYQIFYIIGGAIFGLGALGAFIIYLVKGKKTY